MKKEIFYNIIKEEFLSWIIDRSIIVQSLDKDIQEKILDDVFSLWLNTNMKARYFWYKTDGEITCDDYNSPFNNVSIFSLYINPSIKRELKINLIVSE